MTFNDLKMNIFAFQNIFLAKILRIEIIESKAKCFVQCYSRHCLAVCQTYLLFLLGTEIVYISQPSLQLGVRSRRDSFQKNVGSNVKMMYNSFRAARNHLSHYARLCMPMQGELRWLLLKTAEHLSSCF